MAHFSLARKTNTKNHFENLTLIRKLFNCTLSFLQFNFNTCISLAYCFFSKCTHTHTHTHAREFFKFFFVTLACDLFGFGYNSLASQHLMLSVHQFNRSFTAFNTNCKYIRLASCLIDSIENFQPNTYLQVLEIIAVVSCSPLSMTHFFLLLAAYVFCDVFSTTRFGSIFRCCSRNYYTLGLSCKAIV